MERQAKKKGFKVTSGRKSTMKAKLEMESPNKYRAMPTRLDYSSIYTFVRRYAATSAINGQNFTITDIFGSFVLAVTTTQGYSPFQMMRIKKFKSGDQ